MRVLLLTGPGGDAQGWGDLGVTQCVGEAIKACGHSARIAWIETDSDFHKAIKDGGFRKATASIQGDEIRVSSPSKDELQAVMALLRGQDFGIELKFGNYRG